MPLSKALAALSAGALLLIGQAGLAQDSYSDKTADETKQSQPAVDRARQGQQADDPMVVQEGDDPYAQDENDPLVADADDEFSSDFSSEENEFTVEERTTTETDTYTAQTTQSQGRAFSAIPCACEVTSNVAVIELNDTKLGELAHIQAHLDHDIVGITNETTLAERKMEIISRHDWSRQEFNQAVEQVNQDPELEARVSTMVESERQLLVSADTQASESSYSDEVVVESDSSEFDFESDTAIDADAETEFQAEADLEDDEAGDWEADADMTASVDTDDEDEDEDQRDW